LNLPEGLGGLLEDWKNDNLHSALKTCINKFILKKIRGKNIKKLLKNIRRRKTI